MRWMGSEERTPPPPQEEERETWEGCPYLAPVCLGVSNHLLFLDQGLLQSGGSS